jgi:pimeloyl-ACP methyl ester carboxylesterase
MEFAASAQQPPAAVVTDPPINKTDPQKMEAPDIPSHGSRLNSVMYLAAGAGAHPTVVLLHGFPGNEKNLDLAYSIRREGWNVLIPHYRGSWGSQGTFTFANAIEDTLAAVQFLRDNASRYRVDPTRIVLIGHSMGGFMASRGGALDKQVAAVGMLAAWNIGAEKLPPSEKRASLFKDSAPRLSGSTPQSLMDEIKKDSARLNYLSDAVVLKDRPVLVLEADDGNARQNHEMVEALRKEGNQRVSEKHLATDHVFSDQRIAFQSVIIEWLQSLETGKTSATAKN